MASLIQSKISTKLNMSRRIRRTPYTKRVEECGVTDFTVVNHMLLPKSYKATLIQELSKGGSEDLAKIIKGI